MAYWLYHLPDLGVFAVLTVPFVLAVVVASHAGGRILGRFKPDDSSFEIMDAFIAVASAAAIVLAFALVQVDTTLKSVDDTITKEAGAINALDRALLRIGDAELEKTRSVLMEYAGLIVKEEWQLLAEADRSEKVDGHYRTISARLRATEPKSTRQVAIFGEALKAIDQMGDLREARISAASSGLSPLFWKSIVAIFVLLVLIAFHTEPTRRRVWSMIAIAGTLGVLLALVIILDAPFSGENTVEADAIERVMDVMLTRK